MPLSPNPDAAAGSGTSAEVDPEPRSFEAAYGELQRVVDQLEDGGLELGRALRLFERGAALALVCERFVDEAELRVTRLVAESASPLSDAAVDA